MTVAERQVLIRHAAARPTYVAATIRTMGRYPMKYLNHHVGMERPRWLPERVAIVLVRARLGLYVGLAIAMNRLVDHEEKPYG